MRELWRGLLDLLLPPTCAACGAPAQLPDLALCARCHARLPRIPCTHCALCQQREAAPGAERCLACARRRGALAQCVAGCWFEGDAAHWIRAFKYPARRQGLGADARARLRALALETLALAPQRDPDAVVPVPLHPQRLRRRGFNPALVLARQIGRERGLAVRPLALERIRDTQSQTGLSRAARRRNVRGAFRAAGPAPEILWLVDDVVTTGATLGEAARVLRRAGARQVAALCAARTPAPARSPRSSPR